MAPRLKLALALCALLFSCKSDEDKSPLGDGGSNDPGGPGASRADGGRADAGSMSGRGQQQCPTTLPSNGSACVPGRGECTVGNNVCDCLNDSNTWACWNPDDCPTPPPAERASCPVIGMACEYTPLAAGEDDLECECGSQGWDCGRQVCPAAEPASASACENGDGECNYGADRVCDCSRRRWACWNQSDCPAAAPVEGTACAVQGMSCDYAAGDCECNQGSWDCEGQRRPRDAGVRDASTGPATLDGGLDASI